MIQDDYYVELMEQKRIISKNRTWGSELSEKEFIKGMCLLNPQSYGSRVENRIRDELGFDKISARDNCGDLISPNGDKVEVKISLLTPSNDSLNMVQIRLFHDVDYYLCIAYDCRDIKNFKKYTFLLTHDQMEEECKLNAGAAHGTGSVNSLNENVELRLGINCIDGNDLFERWKREYLCDDYKKVIECIQKK